MGRRISINNSLRLFFSIVFYYRTLLLSNSKRIRAEELSLVLLITLANGCDTHIFQIEDKTVYSEENARKWTNVVERKERRMDCVAIYYSFSFRFMVSLLTHTGSRFHCFHFPIIEKAFVFKTKGTIATKIEGFDVFFFFRIISPLPTQMLRRFVNVYYMHTNNFTKIDIWGHGILNCRKS